MKLLRSADMLYIPRYCYPLIPTAKRLGKKVIVHLHDYQPISYNATILCNSGRASFKVFQDSVRFELFEHTSIVRALLSTMFNPINRLSKVWISDADEILCTSWGQKRIMKLAIPELADKLKVIYNPLPKMPILDKELDDPTFLYVGGDSYVKGFYILLEASRRILQKNLNVRFLLAGAFKASNRHLVEKLNNRFNRAYNFLGHLRREEVLKLHSVSSALLFPSVVEEPLPYAVLEAMLSETMPLASKVGGVPEIVDGTHSEKMMFAPGGVDTLVANIESILCMSREQLADIGHQLREAVLRKFSNERIKQELVKSFAL